MTYALAVTAFTPAVVIGWMSPGFSQYLRCDFQLSERLLIFLFAPWAIAVALWSFIWGTFALYPSSDMPIQGILWCLIALLLLAASFLVRTGLPNVLRA